MGKKDKKENEEGEQKAFTLSDIRELFQLVNRYGIAEFSLKEGDREVYLVSGKKPATAASSAEDTGERHQMSPFFPTMMHPMVSQATPPPLIAQQSPPASAPVETALNAKAKDKSGESVIDTSKFKITRSPMVGTFYRAPAPDAPSYVEVGDEVTEDTVVCIIEAMKLMNEIKSECKGKVVKILVENATPVEFDQELFYIEPQG